MSRPLVVYLDSSDYSIFSDASRRTPELNRIESKLLQLRDENKIEFRFSHINIIEAAPIKTEDRLSSSQRLETIKRFCGCKCLVSYVFVIENEIESLSNMRPIPTQLNHLNDDGIWFPSLADIKEFSYLADDIRENISKIPDRKKRRQAQRKSFNPDGSVKNAAGYLKGTVDSFAKEICSKYPLTEESAKLAAQSYFNNGSTANFVRLLSDSLSKLENISKWYELSWDEATQLSSFLREIGGNLLKSLEQLKNESTVLANDYKLEGLSDSQIKSRMNESFSGLLNSLPISMLKSLNVSHASTSNQEISWELCPSLLTLTTLSVNLVKLNSLTSRKAKNSDFGDILHATYLPHVDIFRCDGNTASIIEQAKLPIKTRVVSKLTDLPKEIENLLMRN
ncbi:hypothetical protein [Methylophilus aquaticus]|uniref:TIR domain-containing protein n=1 Tax=Methylophilus aquaticus TaxID=1971610 RepID=A0ABT9JPZ4_9PROT|nr:hypothetical protein [Methylophilus aquaticus]MDP8566627.1 hypothetical protein [Methylophilus aquaticus]